MSELNFYPYEELQIELSESATDLRLSCPWVAIEVEVDDASCAAVSEGVRIKSSDFLSNFAEFPILYAVPRENQKKDALSIWDTQGVLELSRVGDDLYHPLAVFTILQRFRLLEESRGSELLTALERLRIANEPRFFEAIIRMLRQTHYITKNCVSSLEPATLRQEFAPGLVTNFIREEQGHDKLVARSLSALGITDLNETEILGSTIQMIQILRSTAKDHPLAFSCAVAAFEGNNFAPEDPIGALLSRSSKPGAAQGIQTHFRINQEGEHKKVGAQFASSLTPVHEREVLKAIQTVRDLCSLANQMTADLAFGVVA